MDNRPGSTSAALDADGASRMCSAFVDALFVDGASISVFGRDGQQSTICASNALAARAETLQFELGEGPHWEALRSGRAVLVPDLGKQNLATWPLFSNAAREVGIAAVFAFPMTMGAATLGVVDLYCTSPRRLDVHQVSLARAMAARYAGGAARDATREANDHSSVDHPSAPAIRREVHQATGMIQAQLDTTTTEAFARLRAYAFAVSRPVDDIARAVVERQLDFRELAD